MQRTKVATLVTLGKVIEKYNTNWCMASQNTLLGLLKTHQSILIHRRMLNYHLADLRTEGLIITHRRNSRRDDGTFCLLSSATCLTMKGAYILFKMGSNWALRHLKAIKKKYPKPEASAPKARRIPADHKSNKPMTYPLKDPIPQN